MKQEEISQTLLAIYTQAQEVPIEQFTDLALGTLKKFIPFDSAIFGHCKMRPNRELVAFSIHLHNQPVDQWIDYQEVSNVDLSVDAAFSNLGRTIAYPSEKFPRTQKFDALRKYTGRYEISQTLLTFLATPLAGSTADQNMHAVSLWRASEKREYTAAEQILCNEMLPHLTRARTLNHHHFMSSAQTTEEWTTPPVSVQISVAHSSVV